MNILIIGSGGREHAIAWKVAQNNKVKKIYVCPGNAGTEMMEICENVKLADFDQMVAFAKENNVGLTIVGPEDPLVAGIVDKFEAEGLSIFGANKAAALLEGSKAYAKEFMLKHGVKTAGYKEFTDYENAVAYLEEIPYPTVVKASGLAAGKGVIICETKEDAEAALKDIMLDKQFGDSGDQVVIEEFLTGVEASILSLYDGKTITTLISAKDHKKIGEGETGLNTGGMGVIAPNPYVTEDINDQFIKDILEPTLKGLDADGLNCAAFIFFGLMINETGVYLLEYNMRMGDPETQVVLPLMKTDFLDLLEAAIEGKLDTIDVEWEEGASCCVVGVAGGYPEAYRKGDEIKNLDKVENSFFLAGATSENGVVKTNGGRVLNIVAFDKTLEGARKKAYADIAKVEFDDIYYRKDIGEVK